MAKIKFRKIPKNLWQYFWDVDVEKLDPEKKSTFVIQRLLDKGNDQAVKWIMNQYSDNQIKETFKKLKDFTPKVGNFWSLFLRIPKNEVECLQTHYLQLRKMHWPY